MLSLWPSWVLGRLNIFQKLSKLFGSEQDMYIWLRLTNSSCATISNFAGKNAKKKDCHVAGFSDSLALDYKWLGQQKQTKIQVWLHTHHKAIFFGCKTTEDFGESEVGSPTSTSNFNQKHKEWAGCWDIYVLNSWFLFLLIFSVALLCFFVFCFFLFIFHSFFWYGKSQFTCSRV